MKREFLGTCLVATMLAAGPTTVWAQGNGNGAARPFSFAAIGDVPYSSLPSAAYDALIAKINADPDVAFSVHIGDIKTGDSLCADSIYSANLDYFNKFAKPLIFSPGDNEWTDCHRTNNGAYNPDERLSLLRNTFFQHNKSLGQTTMPLFKDKAPYVENSKWEEKPAMFIALHQPGSNNNRNRTAGPFLEQRDERAGDVLDVHEVPLRDAVTARDLLPRQQGVDHVRHQASACLVRAVQEEDAAPGTLDAAGRSGDKPAQRVLGGAVERGRPARGACLVEQLRQPVVLGAGAGKDRTPAAGRREGAEQKKARCNPVEVVLRRPEPARRRVPGEVHQMGGPDPRHLGCGHARL